MRQDIAEKWSNALRSGKYTQGKSVLKFTDESTNQTSHCCLGVLCEIAIQDGVEIEINQIGGFVNDSDGIEYSFDGSSGILSETVQSWAGLNQRNPEVNYYGDTETFSWLNDYGELTFEEIADFIDAKHSEL